MEDDTSFLFDIRDWKGFIKSAPTNWSILQLTTINAEILRSSYEDLWINLSRQWEQRTMKDVWSAASYLLNLDSPIVRDLFGYPTKDEKALFNVRFDNTKLFRRECDHKDLSISSRLGCKAFEKTKRSFMHVIPPDYFVYYLGDPHTYFSTIPLFGFKENIESTISEFNGKSRNKGARMIMTIANEAVRHGGLPSYLSPRLCSFSISKPSLVFANHSRQAGRR